MKPVLHTDADILKFWFGHVEETIVPTEDRARIWFGEDKSIDQEIRWRFKADLDRAIAGKCEDWKKTPHGQLALIILLDQFSRHIYRGTTQAFTQDAKAVELCVSGLRMEADHHLSLIERVFYYFPLLHSEQLSHQELAVGAYRTLCDLAFSETRVIFDSFLKFANHHVAIVERFGRFPQRNIILGRQSTPAEIEFIKVAEERDRE